MGKRSTCIQRETSNTQPVSAHINNPNSNRQSNRSILAAYWQLGWVWR